MTVRLHRRPKANPVNIAATDDTPTIEALPSPPNWIAPLYPLTPMNRPYVYVPQYPYRWDPDSDLTLCTNATGYIE